MKKQKTKKITFSNLTQSAGLSIFLREIITNPTRMGAAFPSSDRLAAVMADQIKIPNHGCIIELGGGTGAITAGLLAHGIDADKLIIIERSRELAAHLRKQFPDSKIIHGEAQKLIQLLDKNCLPVPIVVSSLPLRTLPQSVVKALGKQLEQVLEKNGLFVQYTYNWFTKPRSPSAQLKWVRSQQVWWNLPPARVEVFRKIS